jgi:hypothetical protein
MKPRIIGATDCQDTNAGCATMTSSEGVQKRMYLTRVWKETAKK